MTIATRREADTPQRRRGAALERAILDAAYEELSESGYAGFAVESVAARARTGKASIYRRWPSKQLLVLDALCRVMPTPSDLGLTPTWPDDMTTIEALREVAEVIATVASSPLGDVVRAIKGEAASDPELAKAVDDQFHAPRRDYLIALLRRGVERGEVRPGADTAVVADVLPAILVHRVILQREQVTAAVINDLMDQVLIPLIRP